MEGGLGTIGIYYVPTDGLQWAEFLAGKLEEDGYNINSKLFDLSLADQTILYETNVLLVSPDFLHLHNLKPLANINAQRALMVLLGTQASDARNMLLQHNLEEFMQNITFYEAAATEHSVKCLLIGIIKLYEHVHDDEENHYDDLPTRPSSWNVQTANMRKNETVCFEEVEYDLPAKRSSRNVQHANLIKNVAVSFRETKKEVYIMCDRKGNDEIQVEIEDQEGCIKAVYENKVIYKFEIENNKVLNKKLKFSARDVDIPYGFAVVEFPKYEVLPKYEILKDILGDKEDPICLMCKALNLSEFSREALDENLAIKCRSVEPIRRLESTLKATDRSSKGHSSETWPTLIHFAAQYNLPNFCKELLKHDGSVEDSYVMNKDNETPLDIAHRFSHHDIITLLRNGNKDSGVVEDDIPMSMSPFERQSVGSYTDMSNEEEKPKIPIRSNKQKIGELTSPPDRQSSDSSYMAMDIDMAEEELPTQPIRKHDVPTSQHERQSSNSYIDMSKEEELPKLPIRNSTRSIDDLPPPAPHACNPYINTQDIRREDADQNQNPVKHAHVSLNEEESDLDYLYMGGKMQSDPDQIEIHRPQLGNVDKSANSHLETNRRPLDNACGQTSYEHVELPVSKSQYNNKSSNGHGHIELNRSQSENENKQAYGQNNDYTLRTRLKSVGTESDDEYDIPANINEECAQFDTMKDNRSSISSAISIHLSGSQEDIQLPKQAHRHSGFFKRFKLFKQNKKEEKEKTARGRKMSLPNSNDVAAFQKQNPHLFRRASVQQGPISQPRISPAYSEPSLDIKSRENAASKQKSKEKRKSGQTQHFLHETKRRSFRVNKAMNDSINPLPLPEKKGTMNR